MTDALLMDVEPAVVRRSVAEVLVSVADLNLAVIYLYHADVARYERCPSHLPFCRRAPHIIELPIGWWTQR